jgi:hypothetical protein
MDPLSVTASVIAVLQITNSVLVACYRLKEQIKEAENEISEIIDESDQLASILEAINEILKENPESEIVFASLAVEEDGKGPLMSIKAALLELNDKLAPLKKRGIKSKLLWPFESKNFQKLLASIQNQKSTLLLALQSCQTKLLVHHTVSTQGIEKRRKRENILKWFKTSDPEQNHNKSRKDHDPGTVKWIFDVKHFKSWAEGEGDDIWIHGIPGAGKTILCSTIINYM